MKVFIIVSCIIILNSALTLGQKSYGSELSGTVAIPTGANSQFYKTGYGAIAGMYYEMESDWRIGLTVGFIRFGIDNNEVNNYFQQYLDQNSTVDVNGSVSAIPVLVSFKYLFPGPTTRFYAIIEGGLYTYWTKFRGNIIYSDGSAAPLDNSEFNSEVGFALGLGALFPVNDEISIDAGIRYHIIRNSGTIKVIYDKYNNGEEKVGTSNFLNISIGVNWNFDL